MIKVLSSWRTKLSPRSVSFKWSGNRLSGFGASASCCRRIVLKGVSVFGSCPAKPRGKDRIAECKMARDGSSLSPDRDLI